MGLISLMTLDRAVPLIFILMSAMSAIGFTKNPTDIKLVVALSVLPTHQNA